MAKAKDPAAVKMAKKRWEGVSAEDRKEAARKAVNARWARARRDGK